MKTCGRCKETKSFEEFSKCSGKADGYQTRCKQCSKEAYWEKRDELIAKKKAYNLQNKDRNNARGKMYRDSDPEKNKNRKLKYYYNITLTEYNKMLESQNYVCAICYGTNETTGKDLFVDHDHSCCSGNRSCGECVRGLLCNICNWAIGSMNDDPANFDRAKQYILDFRKT